METLVTYQADFGFLGWLIIALIGVFIMNSFSKKKKDDSDKSEK